ncbi:hypothetical protein RRG08_047164 [Elysia crispata]|uniref:Uncharacterized protein n=1 Tax=Elysia crispata TaxID=231223 RepID=A0AAE1D1R4_9GAST|nr:hypothetical protein RRG08_047164 [Elysia crispata]
MLKRQTKFSAALSTLSSHDSSVYLDVNSPTDNKLSFATTPSSCVDVGSENRLQYERSNPTCTEGPISIPLRVLCPPNIPASLCGSAPPHQLHNSRCPEKSAAAAAVPAVEGSRDVTNNQSMMGATGEEPPEGKTSAMLPTSFLPSRRSSAGSVWRASRAASSGPAEGDRYSVSTFRLLPTSIQRRIVRTGQAKKGETYRVSAAAEMPAPSSDLIRISAGTQGSPNRSSRFSVVPLEVMSARNSLFLPVPHNSKTSLRTSLSSKAQHPVYYLTPDGQLAQVVQEDLYEKDPDTQDVPPYSMHKGCSSLVQTHKMFLPSPDTQDVPPYSMHKLCSSLVQTHKMFLPSSGTQDVPP